MHRVQAPLWSSTFLLMLIFHIFDLECLQSFCQPMVNSKSRIVYRINAVHLAVNVAAVLRFFLVIWFCVIRLLITSYGNYCFTVFDHMVGWGFFRFSTMLFVISRDFITEESQNIFEVCEQVCLGSGQFERALLVFRWRLGVKWEHLFFKTSVFQELFLFSFFFQWTSGSIG